MFPDVRLQYIAVWRKVAQAEIMHADGFVRRTDGAIIHFVAPGYFRCRQQLMIIKVMHQPTPFLQRFSAQSHPVQRHCAPDARKRFHRRDSLFVGLVGGNGFAQYREARQFLRSQLPVETVFAAQ